MNAEVLLSDLLNPTIKEKLFEDNSVSRAGACPENDFDFRVAINSSPYPGLGFAPRSRRLDKKPAA